jgi:hypothetical protein
MTVTEYAIAEYTPLVLTELLSRRPEWKTLLVESVEASPVGTGQMAVSHGTPPNAQPCRDRPGSAARLAPAGLGRGAL